MVIIREGLIPAVHGTAITIIGLVLRNNKNMSPVITGSVIV